MHISRLHFVTFIVLFLYMLLWWQSVDDFFFWDTIQLGSKQAHFFYEQLHFSIFLPNETDSGHFPLFGLYLSFFWNWLGQTLFVSHLVMLPWILMIPYMLYQLSAYYGAEKYRYFIVLIIALEPTLLAQITLISPDVILIASLLASWYYDKKNRPILLSVFFTILCLISLRGFMVAGVFFTTVLILHFFDKKNQKLFPSILPFIPGFVAALSFFMAHYAMNHWIGFHKNSPWAESFSTVDLTGMVYNTGLYIWRMVDFGRIGLYLLLGIVLWKEGFKKINSDVFLSVFLLTLIAVFGLVTVGFQSLTAHRYYLPAYIFVAFFVLTALYQSTLTHKVKTFLSVGLLFFLVSGHFWIYPNHVAQGWDSSLGCRPVFELFPQTETFLEKNSIQKSEVSTFFPFLSEEKYTHLNGSENKFLPFGAQESRYLLLSNINNDAPDSLFFQYNKHNAIFFVEKRGVWIGIYDLK